MKLEIKTEPYNERRMGAPWIAKVDFTDPKGTFTFGHWIGGHRNGSEGLLTLNVEIGDIFATGQKDFRKPANSSPQYYQVTDSVAKALTKAEAYKAWQANQARQQPPAVANPLEGFTDEQIRAEFARRLLTVA